MSGLVQGACSLLLLRGDAAFAYVYACLRHMLTVTAARRCMYVRMCMHD